MQTPMAQMKPGAQTLPHEPQLLASVVGFTHEPLHDTRPAEQTWMHVPITHCPVAPMFAWQTLPHEPQFCALLDRSTQLAPHCEKGAGHIEVVWQAPIRH